MRTYIIGSVASGKSTLAERLSRATGIACCHLDEVVYEEDPADSWGNRRRPEEEIERRFREVLDQESYIMEDTGRKRFMEGMARADEIVLLDPPLRVLRARILRRWIRQNLGLERCIYRPRLRMLRSMFGWARDFETGADGTRARVECFSHKMVTLRSKWEVEEYVRGKIFAARRDI